MNHKAAKNIGYLLNAFTFKNLNPFQSKSTAFSYAAIVTLSSINPLPIVFQSILTVTALILFFYQN